MGILFISSEFPPHPGGIGNHTLHLARMLQLSGKDVHVLTEYRGPDTEAEESAFDSSLPFKVQRVRRYRLPLRTYLMRLIQSWHLLQSRAPGTVIASGRFPLWLAAGLSLFSSQCRFVAVLHGSELGAGSATARLLTRWSLQRFQGLIAVSHFTAQLAEAMAPGLTVQVIPNGFAPFPETAESQAPRLPGRPALVTVGNVTRRKGQQNVIKALPEIRKVYPEAHYHIVGIPTEQEDFMDLAHTLGVADGVTFHGVVPSSRLPVLLGGADVFLMLSERLPNGDVEGFGIAIVEANALGLPAIGSAGCGIEDAILDGYSGRLVNAHNPGEITAAIRDILEHYSQYASSSKSWAAQFTWDKVIERYLNIIAA